MRVRSKNFDGTLATIKPLALAPQKPPLPRTKAGFRSRVLFLRFKSEP